MPKAKPRSSRSVKQEAKPLKRGKNSEPISAQIHATLRQRILKNEYGTSGSLPPELDLVSEFGVSRFTIRAALQKLVIDGVIERRRGTGTTIVQRQPGQGTWSVGSLDQMLGEVLPGEVLFAGAVPGEGFPKVAQLFGIGSGQSLFQVIRLLRAPRENVLYSTMFTRVEFGSRIPKQLLPQQLFLTLLEKYCGLRAVRARQVASAAIAPVAVRKALGLKEHDPALVLQRTFLSRSGEPIEHVETFCRSDTYSQVVDFYREDDLPQPTDRVASSRDATAASR